jgi:hypothetical protein
VDSGGCMLPQGVTDGLVGLQMAFGVAGGFVESQVPMGGRS